MKRFFSPLFICIMLLAACSKESEEESTDSAFAANEALVEPSSVFYMIADVEGLKGISKINYQTPVETPTFFTYPCVSSQTTEGACPNGSVEFASDINHFTSATSFRKFSIGFRRICSSGCPMPDLVKKGPAALLGNAGSPGGVHVIFIDYDANAGLQETYWSYYASDPDAAIEVISLEEGDPSSVATHVVKVRLNVSLANAGGETIKIKNAVFKGVIGY